MTVSGDKTRRYSPRVKRHPCYLCSRKILYDNPLICSFVFRGKTHSICSKCRGLYWGAIEQASRFGKRYRFIEKSEVPRLTGFGMQVGGGISPIAQHRVFTTVFRMLLLIRERQRHQQKESDWMIDEMTRRLLKLADQMAAIIGKTYAVRG
jgi:hypothetical protein